MSRRGDQRGDGGRGGDAVRLDLSTGMDDARTGGSPSGQPQPRPASVTLPAVSENAAVALVCSGGAAYLSGYVTAGKLMIGAGVVALLYSNDLVPFL